MRFGYSGKFRQDPGSVSPLQEPASARPVVVIVDDDPAIRNSLAFSLRTEGIAVLAYASGAELLREIPASGTGCLVIDYKLPGMNGLDLLAELRRRRIATPAILITTHPSAARARARGRKRHRAYREAVARRRTVCGDPRRIGRIGVQLKTCVARPVAVRRSRRKADGRGCADALSATSHRGISPGVASLRPTQGSENSLLPTA